MISTDVLKKFADKQDRNDFERMAIHNDVFMREKIKEMLAALEKFSVSGDYCDYIAVSNSFDDVAKFMNARDSYMTHNPDRNY
jgi:hypothetical protein